MNAERRPQRWLWVLGVLLLVAMILGARYMLNGNGSPGDGRDNEAAPPGVLAQGLIDNEKGVASLYPLQPGRVLWVIKEGAHVQKDAVLLKLDSTLALAQFKQAEADLAAAAALVDKAKIAEKNYSGLVAQQKNAVKAANLTVDMAKEAHEKAKEAFKAEAITKFDLKQAELNLDKARVLVDVEQEKLKMLEAESPSIPVKQAEANRDAKKAQLDAAAFALNECELRAPEDGQVLRVQAHLGDVLGPNPKAPAIQFSPKGGRIARAEVLQEWADRVYEGQEVIVESEPRSTTKYKGRVRSVSDWFTHKRNIMLEPFMVNDVRTLECIIDIPGNPTLRIGQRVRITFVTNPSTK